MRAVRPSPTLPAATAVLVAAAALAGTTDAAVADEVEHRTVFTFDDRDITESSGLVAREGVMFTVNDSGADPVVYAVDSRSGDTVGVTTYSSDDVSDVEAVAPGPDGSLWVGDIGDNDQERSTVDAYRVPIGQPRADSDTDAEKYPLAYPDGPQNAETLLVNPRNGRMYVVSKAVVGGTVYAAPAAPEQDTVNTLRAVGGVPGLVTDGAFFPDGRHVVLRTYATAAVYTFPELREVGRMDLPAQEQGEAVAVDGRGRVFLSTEGAFTDVLQILLPQQIRAALGHEGPTALPTRPAAPEDRTADPTSDRLSTDEGDGVWVAGGVLLVTLAGWLFLTASRRRGRRRR